MSRHETSVEARFRDVVEDADGPRAGDRALVALSGGLDSVVLLHLLRFGCPLPGVALCAAHFDHGMREGSTADARWVAGLCHAWGVTLHTERAAGPLRSEGEAREARYDFLERMRAEAGARWLLTAHHADDQAETVLFRALRGTGQAGLAGIPPRREPALWRPLLGFWREELEGYAARAGLEWREDPTNAESGYARNVLRGWILPEIERLVAPGARRALVRLADLAREDEAGWKSVLPAVMGPLATRRDEGSASLDRAALTMLHPAVRARVLRALAADLGLRLDEAATKLAVDFASSAASGRRIQLGGGWSLHRELDRLVLRADVRLPPDAPLRIPDRGPGSGRARLGGWSLAVVWGEHDRPPAGRASAWCFESFDADVLRFPLSVRAQEAGDRIRLPTGTKKVKKLFLERRISRARRGRLPLVVDAEGEVLWIPEVARAEPPPGRVSPGGLRIGIG